MKRLGEHFTPRDIVRLTTALVFMEDDDVLTKDGIIRTIYDPTAGAGWLPVFRYGISA